MACSRASLSSQLLAGVALFAVRTVGAAAPAGPTTLTCTNAVSGANWKLSIDFGRSTVDANPARISDTSISWHDHKDGGNYTLDRKTGKLTVILASSTGGYFLYDNCR